MAPAKSEIDTVLDPTAINMLREMSTGNNTHFINEFIDLYLRNSVVMVDEIRDHAESDDSVMLRAAAHKLKGSTLNVGGMQVAAICGVLEKKARKKGASEVMELVESLVMAYEALREELAAIRVE